MTTAGHDGLRTETADSTSAAGTGGGPGTGGKQPQWWRQSRTWQVVAAVLVAALIGTVLVNAWRRGGGGTTPAASSTSQPRDGRTLLQAITGIDAAVVGSVGDGGVANGFVAVHDAPTLVGASGHPRVVFVADEPCGVCAVQRWSVVIALSRFGTLHNLLLSASAPTATHPAAATFSFSKLAYSSEYIDLTVVETLDRAGKPAQTLSAADQQLMATYDAPPYVPTGDQGARPWLDVANRYVMAGGLSPAVLNGLNWGQIAERLSNPNDPVGRAIVGVANRITATICAATGMQPAGVCRAPGIAALVPAH